MSAGRASRLPVIAVGLGAMVALVAGVWSGLGRLAVDLPGAARATAFPHGALMVSGFAGTVIGLERAVASGRGVAFAGPAASVAGAVLLVAGAHEAAAACFALAGAVLAATMLHFWRLQPAPPALVIASGAAAWAAGCLYWLASGRVHDAVPWWMAFLALTIAGERLELTRFRRQPLAPLVAGIMLLAGGLLAMPASPEVGARVVGGALALIGAWLAWTDTARLTVRRGGLATYAGAALLASYVSLVAGGAMLAADGWHPGTTVYDSALHLFFVGFVMGAIFAHAPIILPAITGLTLRITAITPTALVLLYVSLAVRVAGNAATDHSLRQAGGSLHGIAFLLFVVGLLVAAVRGRRAAPATSGRPS